MNKKRKVFLLGLALVFFGVTAGMQSSPGYMDADYYFYGAKQLSRGEGFQEMVLWNYLDDPSGLPHASHTYWMPLTSIAALLGIKSFPFLDPFTAAQVLMVLIAVGGVWVTIELTLALTGQEDYAQLAGGLAIFSGLYLPFITTTDAFGLYIMLGGLFFLTLHRRGRRYGWILGGIAGFMHLARADGVLWIFAGIVGVYLAKELRKQGVGLLGGYVLIMAAWYWRNWNVYGALMPPGSSATMWMLDYDELFSYPVSILTFERWWDAGVATILQVRWEAFYTNLVSALVVQGLIFGFPLVLIGGRLHRQWIAVRIGTLVWVMIFLLMTFVFPFSGIRGGFFHSGAALMPLIWAMIPVGLERAVNLLGEKRGWNVGQAKKVFFGGIIGIAVMVSGMRVFPSVPTNWDIPAQTYRQMDEHLNSLGAKPDDLVMVNNPPGFGWVNDRPGIVIPNGDVNTLLAVAKRYNARYILLDENHPAGLGELYENPEGRTGLIYLGSENTVQYFEVE